jgi:ATP-dependent protease Clp ATPase subunit
MYEVPSQPDVIDVVITEDVITRDGSPLVTREQRRAAS